MCINSFNICNQDFQCIGTGIYLAASIIDHSCEPNAVALFEGTTLNIRSVKPLENLDFLKVGTVIDRKAIGVLVYREKKCSILVCFFFVLIGNTIGIFVHRA